MGNFDLTKMCNIIILVGAIVVAIKNIVAFIKKPVNDLSEKANSKEEKHIEEVIDQKVPELLKKHGETVAGVRAEEDRARVDEITNSIITVVDSKMEELKEISLHQGEEITSIKHSIDLLKNAQLDTMRYSMNKIYYKYRPYKKILDCDKKAFIKLYNDYKPMGGNSWIDSLYPEVMSWEVVENWEELEN